MLKSTLLKVLFRSLFFYFVFTTFIDQIHSDAFLYYRLLDEHIQKKKTLLLFFLFDVVPLPYSYFLPIAAIIACKSGCPPPPPPIGGIPPPPPPIPPSIPIIFCIICGFCIICFAIAIIFGSFIIFLGLIFEIWIVHKPT